MNLYSFTLNQRIYLSLLHPSATKEFSEKAILGYLAEGQQEVLHANIVYNPAFLDLFHKVIVLTALRSQDIAAGASQQETGFIYIVDQRRPSEGKDKPEDIVGSFEVLNGTIHPLSYQPNPNYQPISESGIFKIPGDFDQFLELAILT
jgi:hypothetical protein